MEKLRFVLMHFSSLNLPLSLSVSLTRCLCLCHGVFLYHSFSPLMSSNLFLAPPPPSTRIHLYVTSFFLLHPSLPHCWQSRLCTWIHYCRSFQSTILFPLCSQALQLASQMHRTRLASFKQYWTTIYHTRGKINTQANLFSTLTHLCILFPRRRQPTPGCCCISRQNCPQEKIP